MKHICVFLVFLFLSCNSFAMGTAPKPQTTPTTVIENFEDGEIYKTPEWWVFGDVNVNVVRYPAYDKFALAIKGTATDWYVGGVGVYFADPYRDLSKYSHLEMDVYGHGTNSGTLKIELYEDDNGNWQIEQDPKKGFAPISDDKYGYEVRVDWEGWRHLSVPFYDFKDLNKNVGDDIWNPSITQGSGGLLQMQFIAVAPTKTGQVDFIIDNIGFNGVNSKK